MDQNSSPLKRATNACKHTFINVAGFSFCINLLMLTIPIYMMQVFDRVLASRSIDTLIFLTLIALLCLACMSGLDWVRSRLLITSSSWFDAELSPRALETCPASLIQGNSYGAQSLKDITQIRQFFAGNSVFSIFDTPWIPIYLTAIFFLHPYLGILATLGACALFTLAVINERTSKNILQTANTKSIHAQRHIEATLRHASTIHSMGMMPAIRNHWQQAQNEVITLQADASQMSSMLVALSKFTRLALQLAMLGTGAYLAMHNAVSPGAMIAGSIMLGRALAPIEQAMGTWKQLVTVRQAYNRLEKYFSDNQNQEINIQLPQPKGSISLENLTYIIDRNSTPILNNITLQLNVGETLAIIGPTAAGKSSLVKSIVGAITPSRGRVRLDGADVQTWEREDFGKHIGYLPQEIALFPGTVQENIARFRTADSADIIAASQLAGVHELIMHLPKSYDTYIGEGGHKLSGGQQQRIALARALYGNVRLVVLDEPNSNLDKAGDLALIEALSKLKQRGITTIIVSHRPSVLNLADKIAILIDGQLNYFGPPQEAKQKLNIPQTKQLQPEE